MKIIRILRKILQPYKDKKHLRQFLSMAPDVSLKDNINLLASKIERRKLLKIMGSGPSANEAFENDCDCDYMVVNEYAIMDEYKKYKPKYYVVTDSEAFSDSLLNPAWSHILNDTTWHLYFFIPVELRTNNIVNYFSGNSNIELVFFNGNTYFYGPENKREYCYNHNLAIPNPYNVIVGCLYLGIMLRYENIYLYGVEYDFIHNLYVNNNNQVYFRTKHCYDEEFTGKQSEIQENSIANCSVEEFLMGCVTTLRSYKEIKQLALSHHTNIFNCTAGSLIDVFDRKILE